MPYKLVVVVRKDLKLHKGKLAAQAVHAAVDSVRMSMPRIVERWRAEGGKTVIVWAYNLGELKRIKAAASKNIVSVAITDAGRTDVEPGTITCLGLGPDEEVKMDGITGRLKMV